MTADTTYRVVVTRDSAGYWLADVPELEGSHTDAPSLAVLDRYVREVIVLGADLPDEATDELSIEYVYNVDDDLVRDANQAGRDRAELIRREEQLQQRTDQLARNLTARGYSSRDAALLLGISRQRVSQLLDDSESSGGHRKATTTGRRQRRATATGRYTPTKAATRSQAQPTAAGEFVSTAKKAKTKARKTNARPTNSGQAKASA